MSRKHVIGDGQTLFVQALGNSPMVRILDFILTFSDFDYPMTEIARQANVDYTLFKRLFCDLERKNVVVYTRNLGRARYYILNKDCEYVKELKRLYRYILLNPGDIPVVCAGRGAERRAVPVRT